MLDRGDWIRWVKGLIGACISGTAGSLGAGLSTMWVIPKDVNLTDGLYKLLTIMGGTAAFSFTMSLLKYLKEHPLPEDDEEINVKN